MGHVDSKRNLALALAAGALLGSSLLLRALPSPTVEASPFGQGLDACWVTHSAAASSRVVLLGETVDMTLTARPDCPEGYAPLHVVLVLDGSGSMAGEPNREMKGAARNLVHGLNMKENPATQVGVVQYNSAAKILCQLTNRSGVASGCIGRVGASGGTNIGDGIHAALRVLRKGRVGVADVGSVREAIIVVTDGEDNRGCSHVQDAADEAKALGILMLTTCVGTSCDSRCMRQAATSPRYFFEARAVSQLPRVFDDHHQVLVENQLLSMVVTQTIPPHLQFLRGSAEPSPSTSSPAADRITWHFDHPHHSGVTMTWRLRPLEPGLLDMGEATYGWGPLFAPLERWDTFRELRLLVLAPRELRTATPGAAPRATATAIASPSTTPAATAVPTKPGPTPAARPPRERLLFPIALGAEVWR